MIEEKKQNNQHLFGLLGRNISYSFSSGFFKEKFEELELENHQYHNFDLQSIKEFPALLRQQKDLCGMNVTIPYKEEIISYLTEIDAEAKEIGAVNTLKFLKNGSIKGFNTDVFGFLNSLKPLLENHHTKALILGTGGASKAIAFALKKLDIDFIFASRNPQKENEILYSNLSQEIISNHTVIINSTPLGTFPETDLCPEIPYQFITSQHLLYDVIYNPAITTFLQNGKNKGALIKNGLEMLQLQAEKSWQIWNR
ncbi:Shikimate dehydrogenase (NADP(+)) [Polaribacter huanghezhanensis]|uniref:shikimate dehydrogenase family protein n=1 Tax=Polaribacter huanghezhanensis TaxID=1354726 RepID=UPI00264A08A1|nr:shikimate dehydrogenase [Polaribacter huanghezhanensis]WKD84757.1 Shikimate dehydrogenase (NADP(+)) [Polaribacter huanghezhanensis]